MILREISFLLEFRWFISLLPLIRPSVYVNQRSESDWAPSEAHKSPTSSTASLDRNGYSVER